MRHSGSRTNRQKIKYFTGQRYPVTPSPPHLIPVKTHNTTELVNPAHNAMSLSLNSKMKNGTNILEGFTELLILPSDDV